MKDTIIIRHKKENLKKCSLRGLENLEHLKFYTYPKCLDQDLFENLSQCICLSFEGPELSPDDKNMHLVLIDGTWKLAEKMYKQVPNLKSMSKRSLPKGLMTAYPRRQEDCSDPSRGLASVEALYAAYKIMGLPCEQILDHYHWKEDFLAKNGYILGSNSESA